MAKTIKDVANSVMLVGSLAFSVLSFNTSSYMQNVVPTVASEHSQIISNDYNSSISLREYSAPKQKFNVEIEAENIFGKMRSATIEEQNSIMKGIKSISKPVGVNFWDLC